MRLFVALALPDSVCLDLERRTLPLRPRLPEARWVRPQAIHLTLAFLGDTPEVRLEDLHRELAPAFAAFPAMPVRVSHLGAFPTRGPSWVVWAGLEADGDLAGLQARVRTAVERALDHRLEDRGFHAHLTLARCRNPWPTSALDTLREGFAATELPPPFRVAAGTLFASELRPSGAVHRIVREYPLGEESK